MAEAAKKTDPDFDICHIRTREELLEHLSDYIQPGDTVLVKASHFMKFEDVVQALKNCRNRGEFDERFLFPL